MKQFNLEEAKQGKPVCTRNGLPVKIIYFDRKDSTYPIVALVDNGGHEEVRCFTKEGKWLTSTTDHEGDLFMVGKKHTGYINIYNMKGSGPCSGCDIYSTKEEAQKNAAPDVVDTIKIEWED